MSKTVGMMQPYLFPYIGYFQLIEAVDVFVLGDDLQYVKESWINRNRILQNGTDRMITFPLKKGDHRAKINERFFAENFADEMNKLARVIYNAYVKAPQFKKAFPFLEEVIKHPETNLAKYAENSIRKICGYLGVSTPIVVASDLGVGAVADKQDRVVKTVKRMGGDTYINPIGGVDLYDFDFFREHGVELKFHQINALEYRQFSNAFVPLLSIIDALMFNDVAEVRRKLACYSLLDSEKIRTSFCDQCEPCRLVGVG